MTRRKDARAARIAALNDAFRASLVTPAPLGRLYMTDGIASRGREFVTKVIAAIVAFNGFDEDINPHQEHDMMRVVVDGTKVWAKVDLLFRRQSRPRLGRPRRCEQDRARHDHPPAGGVLRWRTKSRSSR